MSCFRRKRRCGVHLLLYYTTVILVLASTSFVIWNFRDECYQFHMPPSERHLSKCRRQQGIQKEFITFEVTKTPMNSEKVSLSGEMKSLAHRDLRTALGPIPSKSDQTYPGPDSGGKSHRITSREQDDADIKAYADHFKIVQSNVIDYFSDRRKSTQESCLKMFNDEENINLDTTDGDEFLGQLKKLEKLERGENRFFGKTDPKIRTRWIFYKHPQQFNNLEIQWCPLYKSASSPWMAIFAKLVKALTKITEAKIRSGKITFVDLAKDFRLYIPRGDIHSAEKSPKYSMVVVRHPFKRLLSAYQDKIERIKGREYYYRKYSKNILRRYRPPANLQISAKTIRNSGKGGGVPAWYRMALDLQSRYGVSNEKSTKNAPTVSNYDTSTSPSTTIKSKSSTAKLEAPTFGEFCRYLLQVNPQRMDEHWRPQYLDCSPCHHKFDLILKVETLEKDKEAVFKLLGYAVDDKLNPDLIELEQVWRSWTNPSKHSHNESYFFSQLSEEVMQSLYHLYEPDFELFGYSPDDYFDMVSSD